MSAEYICGRHQRVGCKEQGCNTFSCRYHSPACQCVLCLDARALRREQVRDPIKCTKLSDSTTWCVCSHCTGPRVLSYRNISKWTTCSPLTPHGEKLRILDRMRESIIEWLKFNVNRKAWDKVTDIAALLRDIEEERTK